MERVVLEISWGSILRVLLIGFLGFVLFAARDVVLALLLVLVISAGLTPAVNYLEQRRIPRVLGTIGLFVLSFLIIGLVIYAVLPVLILEFDNLVNAFTSLADYSGGFFNATESAEAIDSVIRWLRVLEERLFSGDIQLISLTSNILGGLTLTFSVIILSFYLAASKDGVERFLRAVLPEKSEEYVLNLFARVKEKIGVWFRTQILLSLVIGVVTFVGLWLLDVKYALVLSVFAGALEIIPFVGPIFAGALAAIVGFSDSTALGIYVVILFLVIQQLESSILIPFLFRRSVGLHPVLVLSSLLVGGKMAGLIGVILAVPVAAAIQEIVEDWGARKGRNQGLL